MYCSESSIINIDVTWVFLFLSRCILILHVICHSEGHVNIEINDTCQIPYRGTDICYD